ncbi:MAG: hypothetical protein QXT45_04790 [Candidatus Bilamarchaeaceae archaeon]
MKSTLIFFDLIFNGFEMEKARIIFEHDSRLSGRWVNFANNSRPGRDRWGLMDCDLAVGSPEEIERYWPLISNLNCRHGVHVRALGWVAGMEVTVSANVTPDLSRNVRDVNDVIRVCKQVGKSLENMLSSVETNEAVLV